ncbi:mdlA [Symbiodinium microadriaticum]|nr:mdlA [Symbiodinium sp. KB8]CAE7182480.1 mdlA [Symbiodinium microadriaticum]
MPPKAMWRHGWLVILSAVGQAYNRPRGQAAGVNGYVEAEARHFFQLSRAAFCDATAIETWSCGEPCEQGAVVKGAVKVLQTNDMDVHGFVARQASFTKFEQFDTKLQCVAVFKGSIGVGDYTIDARVMPKRWPSYNTSRCASCMVHSGFADLFDELRRPLISDLRTLGCQNVTVTGHSLGAALAVLAAVDLAAEGFTLGPVVTFGQPRVGNAAFAAALTSATSGAASVLWRVVHHHDPVPRLPLRVSGYMHPPTEIYYFTEWSDAVRVCSSHDGEEPEAAASFTRPHVHAGQRPHHEPRVQPQTHVGAKCRKSVSHRLTWAVGRSGNLAIPYSHNPLDNDCSSSHNGFWLKCVCI